ncbi:MAG: peptidoglycan-binding protein [Clostridia bacterium]|nr:peptidoglycan-binding protein [Clostridia bacterium]
MKKSRLLKLALACLLLCVPLILSGCVVQPENIPANNTGNYPEFPTYNPSTPKPTVNPTQFIDNSGNNGGMVSLPTLPASTNPPVQNNWYTVAPLNTINRPETNTLTPPPDDPTPSPTPQGSLKLGAKGEDVKTVQRRLKDLGFYKGSVDGDFGEGTESAVKRFQEQYGLEVDGKVGKYTLQKLSTARQTAKPTAKPTPKATATPTYDTSTFLRKGDTSSKVRQMQERLISLGYLAGKANATFDAATEAAVIAFQKRNCSYYDGVAGPETLKALYSSSARSTSTVSGVIGVTLRNGDDGDSVRALQTRLKALGYYKGNVDGDYGSGTVEAVKSFQRAHSLSVDGSAGSSTLNTLFSDKAKTASAANAKVTSTPRRTNTPRPAITPRPTRTPLPANTYVLVTPPPDGQVIYVTLQRGHYGTLVERLQRELKNQGYYNGATDGYFGEGTENAVKSFQRVKGLEVDGIAGTATLRRLYQGDFPAGA